MSTGPQTVGLWQDESEPSTPGTSIASRSSGDSTDISSLLFRSKQAPNKLTAISRLIALLKQTGKGNSLKFLERII